MARHSLREQGAGKGCKGVPAGTHAAPPRPALLLPPLQTDVKMPRRHLAALADSPFNAAFQSAIEAAVQVCWAGATGLRRRLPARAPLCRQLPKLSSPEPATLSAGLWLPQAAAAEDKDVRVLNLGAGAGLHAMMALRAGAHHVTAVERWLYLALACKETLAANQVRREGRAVLAECGAAAEISGAARGGGPQTHRPSSVDPRPPITTHPPTHPTQFTEAQYRAVYKRPTDLKLLQDVPVCCNLLVANVLDEGGCRAGRRAGRRAGCVLWSRQPVGSSHAGGASVHPPHQALRPRHNPHT